jgi:hypothetical protein
MRIEQKILSNLIHDEHYCRKVIPFLKKEYFTDRKEAILTSEIVSFFTKYNKPVTKEILSIEVSNRKDLNDKELVELTDYIGSLNHEPVNEDWMLETPRSFVKIERFIMRSLIQLVSSMGEIKFIQKMRYLASLAMHSLFLLIITSVMTIWMTIFRGLIFITGLKRRFLSTLTCSTKSPKVDSQRKP